VLVRLMYRARVWGRWIPVIRRGVSSEVTQPQFK
jgi:hypothetical protein